MVTLLIALCLPKSKHYGHRPVFLSGPQSRVSDFRVGSLVHKLQTFQKHDRNRQYIVKTCCVTSDKITATETFQQCSTKGGFSAVCDWVTVLTQFCTKAQFTLERHYFFACCHECFAFIWKVLPPLQKHAKEAHVPNFGREPSALCVMYFVHGKCTTATHVGVPLSQSCKRKKKKQRGGHSQYLQGSLSPVWILRRNPTPKKKKIGIPP